MKQVLIPISEKLSEIKFLSRLTWQELVEKAVIEYAENHDLKK